MHDGTKAANTDSMISKNKLIMIKTLHTVIWFFFTGIFFYMSYAVIINKIDKYVWFGFLFVFVCLLVYRLST